MGNQTRKIVKKRETQKNLQKMKKKAKILYESIWTSIVMALILLATLIVFLFISFEDNSSELGYLLAWTSVIVTLSFEVYEWIYLIFKEKISLAKNMLVPCLISEPCLLFFMYFDKKNYFFYNTNNSNIVCAGILVIYILLLLLRKIFEDYLIYKGNRKDK